MYKNFNLNIKLSTIYLLDSKLRFLKEICTKLNIESFLFYDKSSSNFEIVLDEILNIDESIKGIILPPILYSSNEDINYLLEKITSCGLSLNFIEIQIKINITNFNLLKNFIRSFEKYFNYLNEEYFNVVSSIPIGRL